MTARRHVLLALTALIVSTGASYRTTNFVVHAPTPQLAQRFGQLAEYYRREKALLWLGREMPPWRQPCPLHISITMSGPSGATSFTFGRDAYGRGMVTSRHMQIQGPLDRLEKSVLPHEITHTVFAHYFGCPVPRWADEGGSVLSEDDVERIRHDRLVRNILNANQQIRLRTLLRLTEYPRGRVMHLYAQGYSLTNYLVNHRSDRQTFLRFVAHGMRYGWDSAAQTYYQHRNVEELEEAWLKHLRDTKGMNHIEIARAAVKARNRTSAGTVVRLTVPTAALQQNQPVVRGQSPTASEREPEQPRYVPTGRMRARPGFLPDVPEQTRPVPPPVPVQLGPPEFLPGSVGPTSASGPISPVGYPR